MTPLGTIDDTVLRWERASHSLIYVCGAQIDADGGPHAYRLDNTGLEDLANAGYPDHPSWYKDILVCDDDGKPVEQTASDPAPGYLISKTALQVAGFAESDPRRYIDAETVPYIVLPGRLDRFALPKMPKLGAKALVINLTNGKHCEAIYADIGPVNKIGELSIACANALEIPANPRTGGASSGILYIVYC